MSSTSGLIKFEDALRGDGSSASGDLLLSFIRIVVRPGHNFYTCVLTHAGRSRLSGLLAKLTSCNLGKRPATGSYGMVRRVFGDTHKASNMNMRRFIRHTRTHISGDSS